MISAGCAGEEGEAPVAGTPVEEVEEGAPAEEEVTELVTPVEVVTGVEAVTPVEEDWEENVSEPTEITEDNGTAPTEEETPETDYFEKYLKEYEKAGKIESTVPEKMRVGKTEIITAYITRNISENTVGEIEENQTHISSNIAVTPKMKVTLEGKQEEAFTVYPLTSDIQPITGQRTTIWKWRVTPQKSGKQALMMNVYLVIPSDSGETTSYIDELEKEIEVEVNPTYFVERNWQWIAGTIIGIPTLILTVLTLYGHVKKPKRK